VIVGGVLLLIGVIGGVALAIVLRKSNSDQPNVDNNNDQSTEIPEVNDSSIYGNLPLNDTSNYDSTHLSMPTTECKLKYATIRNAIFEFVFYFS
jgi:hypothetical protein